MLNYRLEADVVPLIAPRALKSGDVVSVGKVVGVATTDAASGATVQVLVEGAVEIAKGSVTPTQGQAALIDQTAQTLVATGGTLLGYVITVTSPDNSANCWVKIVPSAA